MRGRKGGGEEGGVGVREGEGMGGRRDGRRMGKKDRQG